MVILLAACTWIDDADWERRTSDIDRDGDREDCDDDDPDVNTEQDEIQANGVDDDCDGWDYLGELEDGEEDCLERVREGGRMEARWEMYYDGGTEHETQVLLQFSEEDGEPYVSVGAAVNQGELRLGVMRDDDVDSWQKLRTSDSGDRVALRTTVDTREDIVSLSADGSAESVSMNLERVTRVCAVDSWPRGIELYGQITVYAGD